MNWFLIALINPIAHALANHFDKYLLSRYMKGESVGSLVLFSALFGVVTLPILYWINPSILTEIDWLRAVILLLNGGLLMLAILFYLYALDSDEASYVVPLFQLIPLFGFVLGYFVLGEVLHSNQLWAAILIVLGSTVLSLEIIDKWPRLKLKLLFLMVGASLAYAINGVVFKWIAGDQGFTSTLFWDMAGTVLFGIGAFIGIRSYRVQFLTLIKRYRYSVIGLNVINEVLGLVGEIALVLALLYAPVALVQSVGGLQPLFVFIIGIVITLFFPKFGKESLAFHHLTMKIVGIVIITVGIYFLQTH